MTFFKTLTVAAALAGGIGAGAAQAQDYQPQRVVTEMTSADMEAVITGWGHTVERVIPGDGNGGPLVIGRQVRDDGGAGLTFVLGGNACGPAGPAQACRGVEIIVLWDHNDRTRDPAFQMELNAVFAAMKVMVTDQSIGVQRYLILDRGQTMENIGFNLAVVLDLAVSFQDRL